MSSKPEGAPTTLPFTHSAEWAVGSRQGSREQTEATATAQMASYGDGEKGSEAEHSSGDRSDRKYQVMDWMWGKEKEQRKNGCFLGQTTRSLLPPVKTRTTALGEERRPAGRFEMPGRGVRQDPRDGWVLLGISSIQGITREYQGRETRRTNGEL